jgi:orotate phosphoribosyltransferase-like protein
MVMPSHKPTSESRESVTALKSFGNTDAEIATYLDISVETLTKYYKRELETAVVDANRAVANSLFKKATKGNDVSAQTFWLKTRARWRTVDTESLLESNESLKKELQELKAKLDEKNKKDY